MANYLTGVPVNSMPVARVFFWLDQTHNHPWILSWL